MTHTGKQCFVSSFTLNKPTFATSATNNALCTIFKRNTFLMSRYFSIQQRSQLHYHTHHVVVAQSKGDTEEPVFDNAAAKAAEIQEVIEGLNSFKQRIIDDATTMAKKLKTSPKVLKEALAVHPDILKIDETVKNLEKELNELESFKG